MTTAELDVRMSGRELMDWAAFYKVERREQEIEARKQRRR